jgi:hypothetical protein
MEFSGSYVIVESMIRQNKIVLSELEQLVNSLTRRGLITTKEQQSLLLLARKVLPKSLPDV